MNRIKKESIIKMLETILEVEDIEIKNCAIETLIEIIKDLKEEPDEENGKNYR